MTDFIEIKELVIEMSIGAYAWEQQVPQKVIVDVKLMCDTSRAGNSDHLTDAIDYVQVADSIVATAKERHYTLIESFAETASHKLLNVPGVEAIDLTVTKPGAIVGAGSVSVTIHRPA